MRFSRGQSAMKPRAEYSASYIGRSSYRRLIGLPIED